MGLQGNLETFALPDVLRLLAATRKTGCLHIEGDHRRGSAWLHDGALVEATFDRALDGESTLGEDVFEMLRLGTGSFRFAPGEPPPVTDRGPEEIETAIGQAPQLLEEWRELATIVPSLDHRVVMAPELLAAQVTLDVGRWTALVAIADGPSVIEVARMLGLGELDVLRTISDLVELGVAVVAPPTSTWPRHVSGHLGTGELAALRTTTGEHVRPTGGLRAPIGSDQYPLRRRTGQVPAIDPSVTGWS